MKSFKNFLDENSYSAKEGESEIVHHATPHSFDIFNRFSHFGTKNAARARAYTLTSEKKLSKKELDKPENRTYNIHSGRINLGNVAEINDVGNFTPERILNSLLKNNHITKEEHADWIGDHENYDTDHNGKPTNFSGNALLSLLRQKNINTLKYKNNVEDVGNYSYVTTEKNQFRRIRKSSSPLNLERGKKYLTDVNI